MAARRPGQSWRMGASKDDEKAAYKSTPTSTPQFTAALTTDPITKKAVVYIPRGDNFGHRLAGRNYSRKMVSVAGALIRFFAVPIGTYIDDATIVEPDFAAGPLVRHSSALPGRERPRSGQAALWDLCDDLEIAELSPGKVSAWSEIMDPIGIEYDFSAASLTGDVMARVKPSTAATLAEFISGKTAVGNLTAADDISIAGKFRWVACLGQVGVALTQPLYKLKGRVPVQLSSEPDLKAALQLIVMLTQKDFPPAVFKSAQCLQRPILIFSDAFWKPQPPLLYGVAGVAYIVIEYFPDGSEKCTYAAQSAPVDVLQALSRLEHRRNPICPLEEIAMAGPFLAPQLIPTLRRRDILHFADNMGANAIAIKGYSSSLDLARIVSITHFQVAQLQARWWVSFVPSEFNPADPPSRDDFQALQARNARRIDFLFPDMASWS